MREEDVRWKEIHRDHSSHTYMLKVEGGWLIRCNTGVHSEGAGITFISDPEHKTPPIPMP